MCDRNDTISGKDATTGVLTWRRRVPLVHHVRTRRRSCACVALVELRQDGRHCMRQVHAGLHTTCWYRARMRARLQLLCSEPRLLPSEHQRGGWGAWCAAIRVRQPRERPLGCCACLTAVQCRRGTLVPYRACYNRAGRCHRRVATCTGQITACSSTAVCGLLLSARYLLTRR